MQNPIQQQRKKTFKPRQSKNEAPLGWSPVFDSNGKPKWRCKDVQFVFGYNEYRRCSHICEKKYIKHHKNHVYTIPQADDDDFPLETLKSAQKITHHEFNRRYLYQLALLCGKLDISCNKAISDSMRQFTLFLLNEGFTIGRNPETDQILINKCLDEISINQLTEQIINAAENEFQKNIRDFQDKKFCALLCDAGTVLKSHCLHFVLTLMGDSVLKIFSIHLTMIH